jgi:WD40 repeat protein/serine/threonine protein kinase
MNVQAVLIGDCPSPQLLERLLDEQLDQDVQRAVAEHVAGCAACQAALEQLTAATDISGVSLALVQQPAATNVAGPLLAHMPRPICLSRTPGRTGAPDVPGYEIIRELGRGGMGVVYQARQIALNRMVALKMILTGAHAGTKHLARFRQEAEAIASLHHPHIVQIYDIGEADGIPYCALEYVADGSLGQQLHGDPQPIEPTVALIETLARTMHFAHQHGIVHRDLKPANILLQRESEIRNLKSEINPKSQYSEPNAIGLGAADFALVADFDFRISDFTPKVTDFGLAKRLDERTAIGGGTLSGEIVGTPSYMAPEQAAGKTCRIGPATDIYALGAILYEMLTGRPPFKGATPVDTVVQVLHEEPVRPSSLRPSLPRDLETICLKCLRKEPGRRYGSAEALAEDLRRFQTGKPIRARRVSAPERAWKWARRRPLIAALVCGMVLSVVLGFAGVTWQWQEASQARDIARAEERDKEQQRLQAEAARAEAVIERQRAQVALYFSRTVQSQLQFRVNNLPGAVASLNKCVPTDGQDDRRGWEWYYLFGLFHADLLTLSIDPPAVGGSAAFDPSGKTIACAFGGFPHNDRTHSGEVRIWDAATGALRRRITVPGTVHRLAFRPDGARIALAATDGTVRLWDTATGAELLRVTVSGERIQAIAFSPNGQRIALAGWDGTVTVCETANGAVVCTFRGHTARVDSVAFHPNGKQIASGDAAHSIQLWDADTGTLERKLVGHKYAVYGLAFSPDGKVLASGSSNGNLRIWDLESGRAIQSLTPNAGTVLGTSFSPDGRYIAYCGGDGTVRVWDVESGVQQQILRGHTAPVESVQFSPDGQRVVSCSPQEGTVRVWDVTRHPERATFARVRGRDDEVIKVRDLTERADAAAPARTGPDLEALAFHSDGRHLVSVAISGNLQIWDATTGVLEQQRTVALSDELVTPAVLAAFAPGGATLAGRARNDRRVVKAWSTATGAETAAFCGHTMPVFAVRYSADGRYLVTAACAIDRAELPHEIKVWDAASGGCLATRTGTGLLLNAVFSPDGRWLALAGQDGAVRLMDWSGPGNGRRLLGHAGAVAALTFSGDGKWLASAGVSDRQLRLWALDSLDPHRADPVPSFAITAPLLVCDLAFNRDNTRLAGISRDVVKLWDVNTRHEVMTLRGAPQRHWDPAFNPRVLFSPDGKRLAGTNWDETISMWDATITGGDEAAIARHQAARRAAADARALFWHLEEAEGCRDHHNRAAARFHLERLGDAVLPPPLQTRKERLAASLAP